MSLDLRLQLLVPARRELFGAIEQAIAGGVTLVQLREKTLPDGETLRIGAELAALVRGAGALLSVNDRPDLALALGADGVHVGQGDLPLEVVRKVVGPRLFIGVSSHNLSQAQGAAQADYVAFGPIFPTPSKEDAEQPTGVERLREVVRAISRPVVAIGGIGRDTASSLRGSGVAGIAVISAILGSPDPRMAAGALLREIGL